MGSTLQFIFDNRLNDLFIETFWHFKKRVKDFVLDIESSNYQHITICTHGYNIAGISNLLTTGAFSFKEMFTYPKPGIITIIKDSNKKVIDFNR